MANEAPSLSGSGFSGHVVSGARWTGLAQIVTQGTRLTVQVVLARLLLPEDFGAVAVALVVVHLLDIVMDLGTGSAIIQRRDVPQPLASAIFVLNAVLGATMCLGLIVFAGPIAGLFGTPDAEPVLQVMSTALIITSLARTQQAMLRRHLHFRAVARVNIAAAAATALVAIPMALLGAGVWALVGGHLAMAFASAVTAYLLSGWLPTRPFDFRGLRSIASYSLNMSGYQLTEFLLQNADKVVIGRFLGVVPLGVYSVAERFMRYPVYALARVLAGVLFPAMARAQDDADSIRNGLLRSTGAIALISLPIMIGLATVAEDFTRVVLSDRWLDAVPLMQVLAPAGALQAIMLGAGTVFPAMGRADLQFRLGIATGLAYLTSYLVGIEWGLTGLAYAYALAVALMAIPGLVMPLRLADIRVGTFARELWPVTFATASMSVSVLLVVHVVAAAGGDSLVRLVAGVASGVIVYGGIVFLLRPVALDDVLSLAGLGRGPWARRRESAPPAS